MPTTQKTVAEFSASIKAKYPQYKDIDDLELAQKIVAKYPEYKDVVQFETPTTTLPTNVAPTTTPEQPQKGFWQTWVGDLLEGMGGVASNLVGNTIDLGERLKPENLITEIVARNAAGKKGYAAAEELRKSRGGNQVAANYLKEKGKELSEKSSDYYGQVTENGQTRPKDFTDFWKEGNYGAAVGNIVLEGGKSLPTSIAAFTPVGLGVIGAGTFNEKYDKVSTETDSNMLETGLNAGLTAGFELLTEKIGAGLEKGFLKDIAKTQGKKQAEKTVKSLIVDFLKTQPKEIATEGLEEGINNIASQVTDVAMGIKSDFDWKETLKATMYGMGGGAFGGATLAGGITAAQIPGAIQNQKATAARETLISEIVQPDITDKVNVHDTNTLVGTRLALYNAKQAMDEALKDTDFTFNPDVVDLDPQDQRDILHDVLAAENLTREQKNTIVEYVSNAALQKTIQETRQKQLDEEIQSQREFLQGAVNVETGTLVRGRLKGDESGSTIFITGGLRLKDNENMQAEIDLENSNEAVYYRNEDGEVIPTTADAIEFVNESGVEQEIQLISEYYQNAYQLQNTEVNAAVQQALMQEQAQQTQPQATEQPTTYAPGTTLEVNGQTFVVGEQDENGNYLINDENGQQIDRFAPDEMEAFGFSAAVMPTQTEQLPITTEVEQEIADNTQISANNYPLLKDGTPDFDNMSVSQTYQYMVDNYGQEEAEAGLRLQEKSTQGLISKNITALRKVTESLYGQLRTASTIQEQLKIREKNKASVTKLTEERAILDTQLAEIRALMPVVEQTPAQPEVKAVTSSNVRPEEQFRREQEAKAQEEAQSNDGVFAPVIAADYLFTGGSGVMLSSEYLLTALAGAFTKATSQIQKIRANYLAEIDAANLGNIKDFVNSDLYKKIMSEIETAINQSYGNNTEIQNIFNQILQYPTGLPTKIGNEISIKLDEINSQESAPVETTKQKRERILKQRTERGEVFEMQQIPETPQKYTINVANMDLPLAPTIPLESIDWPATFGSTYDDYELPNSVKLIEVRGRNNDGKLVGTVSANYGEAGSNTYEVVFNDNLVPEAEQQPVIEVREKEKWKGTPQWQRRLNNLGDAQTLEDVVLRRIAGGAKFVWNAEAPHKGLAQELGFSNKPGEREARKNMIDDKNGITPQEFTHAIYESGEIDFMGEVEYHDLYNAVIDTLLQVNSSTAALEMAERIRDKREFSMNEQAEWGSITPEEMNYLEQIPDDILESYLGITNFTPEQLDIIQNLQNEYYGTTNTTAAQEGAIDSTPGIESETAATGTSEEITPENAQDVFIKRLKQKYPNGLKLYHRTTPDSWSLIQKEGKITASEDVNSGVYTVLEDSTIDRVGGKNKILLQINVPIEEYSALYPEEGTYYLDPEKQNWDGDYTSLMFKTFMDVNPELSGGDIIYVGDIPLNMVEKTDTNSSQSELDTQELDAYIASQSHNNNPTKKQKETGEYDKARINLQGYNITLETLKGEQRSGTDSNGKKWAITMNNHYGELDGTTGYDGDAIDVFVGPNPKEGHIFVIDQVSTDGSFDESKVMLGFDTAEEAKAAYMSNYEAGWQGFGSIAPAGNNFKQWLYDGKKQRKPYAEYKETPEAVSNLNQVETIEPTPEILAISEKLVNKQPLTPEEQSVYENADNKPMFYEAVGRIVVRKTREAEEKELSKKKRKKSKPEANTAKSKIQEIIDNYNDAGNITMNDVINDILSIAYDNDITSILEAYKTYQDELREDREEFGERGDREAIENNFMQVVNDYLNQSEQPLEKVKGITVINEEDNGKTLVYGTKTNQTRLSVKGYTADEVKEELVLEQKKQSNSTTSLKSNEDLLTKTPIGEQYEAIKRAISDDKKIIESTKVTIPWLEQKLKEVSTEPLENVQDKKGQKGIKEDSSVLSPQYKNGDTVYYQGKQYVINGIYNGELAYDLETANGKLAFEEVEESELSTQAPAPRSILDVAVEQVKKNEEKAKNTKVSAAQAEADAALQDFLDAFNDLNSDNLGIVDNTAEKQAKMLVAGTKMVGAFTKLGVYKFAELVQQIQAKGIQITEDLLSAIKKAYGAFAAESDIDELDDMKTVRSFTLNDLQQKKKEDLTPKTDNSPKNDVSLTDQKFIKEHIIFGLIPKTNDNGQPRSTEIIESEAAVSEAASAAITNSASNVGSDKQRAGEVKEQATEQIKSVESLLAEVDNKLANLRLTDKSYSTDGVEADYPINVLAKGEIKKDLTKYIKAVAEITGLAHDTDKKGKTEIVNVNIAPAGGDATFFLWSKTNPEYGVYVSIPYDPDMNSGGWYDNYKVLNEGWRAHILYRVVNKAKKYDGSNQYMPTNVTVQEMAETLLKGINAELKSKGLAEEQVQEIQPAKAETKIKKSTQLPKNNSQSNLLSLFEDEEITPTQNEPERGNQETNSGLGSQEPQEPTGLQPTGVDRSSTTDNGVDGGRSSGISDIPTTEGTRNTRNNVIPRGKEYAPSSPKARFDANIEAIKTVRRLIDSGKQATKADQQTLRQFSGWGGLGTYFNNKYSPENKTLREVLTTEEYESAVMSINSAYYTPAVINNALWDIAEKLGFTGGNVLEGSAGIGNIIGSMPRSISSNTNIEAVEIDEISGNILKYLYPDAKVHIKGFEETNIPNGSVDLAITNVPFVTGLHVYDPIDKDLSKKFKNIHDFCIAKNIRKLKEGGIGIFITSNGTLDKSRELREWIGTTGKTDVIGAFRLNNETFGGTNVTSDIIIVRKRVANQKHPKAIDVIKSSFVRSGEYDTKDTVWDKKARTYVAVKKQTNMEYNDYFKEHPENMGGEMAFAYEKGDTFRPGGVGLYPGKVNQAKQLKQWIETFENIGIEKGESQKQEVAESTEAKEGQLILNEQGQLSLSYRGTAKVLDINSNKVKGETKAQCLKDYNTIKETLQAVLDYQVANESNDGLKPLLNAFNRAYDNFVAKYGQLNKNTTISFLRNDVDFPSIVSIEKYSETKSIDGKITKNISKTAVFKDRVVSVKTELKPTNTKDAVIASIYKYGAINLPYIAESQNKTEQEIATEIISSKLGFKDPATGSIVVRHEYLSGDVRSKLKLAQASNDKSEYTNNIEELQKVIPMDIPAHLIEFTMGTSWLDKQLYVDYFKEKYNVDATVQHNEGRWIVVPSNRQNETNRSAGVYSEMLGITVYGSDLATAAMNLKPITISEQRKDRSTGKTETITDKDATQAANTRVSEIRDDFKEFVRGKLTENKELADKMAQEYNDRANSYVPMEIDDTYLPERFEGATKAINLHAHQKKATIRGTMEPLMLAHEVGAGKTFVLISTAMEMRRLGTANKPMIVVQNATVGQFVSSAKTLYPNAKILTITENDRTPEGRRMFYAKIKYSDWDMIVVPQSTFEMIPDSPEMQKRFIEEKIDEKLHALEALKEENDSANQWTILAMEKEIDELNAELDLILNSGTTDNSKSDNKEAKKTAKTITNTIARVKEQLDRRTDDVQYFDQMGIDALLVDEAHEYKRLGFATSMTRGVKGIDPAGSKKSAGVYLKTRVVLEKSDWKNVVFATGTPISNTAAEIWTFMKYLIPKETLIENEIYYFDDFVRNFGSINQSLEFATNGSYKENTRFSSYINKPELIRLWATVTDTVLSKDIDAVNEKIPLIEGDKATDIFLPQTPSLIDIMRAVKARLKQFEEMSGKEKKANSSIPIVMYGIAKRAAIDTRLVSKIADDEPNSKTNKAVEETLRSLKDSSKYKGTIAIFCDAQNRWDKDEAGKKVKGFDLFEDIKAKLIAKGVAESEIMIIKPGMTVARKEKIFDAVNAGEIRVVLGNTKTLGTGVNMQDRLHTLIHMDAPDRPMDYTQRNGRILRQGNLHKEWGVPVRILRFGVEDSLDVTSYQRLKTKAGFIDSIMDGKLSLMDPTNPEGRILEEDEEGLFDNPVAVLSGSQYALLKNQAERELRKWESKKKQHEADQIYIQYQVKQNEQFIGWRTEYLKDLEKAKAVIEAKFANGVNTITIAGKAVNGVENYVTDDKVRAKVNEAIKPIAKAINEKTESARENAYFTKEKVFTKLKFNGVEATITTDIERESQWDEKIRMNRIVMHKTNHLSIPELSIDYNLGGKSMMQVIETVYESINISKINDGIKYTESDIAQYRSDNAAMEARRGKPFSHGEELQAAKAKVAELTELMKQELAAKEEKYKNAGSGNKVDIADVESEEEETDGEDTPQFQAVSPIGFYSTVESALDKIQQERGTRDQFRAMLLKNGAKQAEMDWMGFDELPEKLTKADIQNWIDENRIEVEEVEKGSKKDWVEKKDTWTRINGKNKVKIVKVSDNQFVGTANNFSQNFNTLEAAQNYYDGVQGYATETKFSAYVLPGGENYKELLLTMPVENRITFEEFKQDYFKRFPNSTHGEETLRRWYKEGIMVPKNGSLTSDSMGFKSSHFDEPNILAHVRFNERTVNGEKVLFIEELQSDWQQSGKKKGFKGDTTYDAVLEKENVWNVGGVKVLYFERGVDGKNYRTINKNSEQVWFKTLDDAVKQANNTVSNLSEKEIFKVPDMPFKKTDQWLNLAARRMMRYAAENGFDRIAWTTGEQQAERYDLSKQVDKIEIIQGTIDGEPIDSYRAKTYKNGSVLEDQDYIQFKDLEGMFGKEIAVKVQNGERVFEGEGLKVGGQGMKAFYDAIVPSAMSKLGKPFGAKVETIDIPETGAQQSIPVTDSMKETAMAGLPLYHTGTTMQPATNTEVAETVEQLLKTGLAKEVRMVTPEEIRGILEGNEQLHAVYHGSPHSFDQFSLDHIGTGEGAQAYGWGLYFTDKKAIAEGYANNLRPKVSFDDRFTFVLDGEKMSDKKRHFIRTYFDSYFENINDLKQRAEFWKKEFVRDVANGYYDKYPKHIYEKDLYLDKLSDEILNAKTFEVIDNSKQPTNLYAVELHEGKDPSEYYYLRWDKKVTDEQKTKVFNQIRKENIQLTEIGTQNFWKGKSKEFENGNELYFGLSKQLGSDKEASLFLLRAGIDGIQYPANYTTGKANETDFNYVVFDPSAITIKEKVQFMRTPSGTIYGFVKGGVVYLNSSTPNLNTPIHEFGHLWVDAIEGSDLYNRGAELVKDTPYWERVNSDPNYKDLSEAARTKEAMAMAIGDKGESVKRNIGLFARIKVWISDVWTRIGAKFGIQNLTTEQIQNLTFNDFVDVAVSELMSGQKLAPQPTKGGAMPATIEVDGVQRPTTNSTGKPIHSTEEGIRNFWRWFGDSKVVDNEGRPLVVYHGSISDFNEFKLMDSDIFGTKFGHFFTPDKDIAQIFANRTKDGILYETYLKLEHPKKIKGFLWDNYSRYKGADASLRKQSPKEYKGDVELPDFKKFREQLQSEGNDGVILNNISIETDKTRIVKTPQYIVFDSTQIKSATGNDGSFDPNEPDIRFQVEPEKPEFTGDLGEFAQQMVQYNEQKAENATRTSKMQRLQEIMVAKSALAARHRNKEVSNQEYAKQMLALHEEKQRVMKGLPDPTPEDDGPDDTDPKPTRTPGQSIPEYATAVANWNYRQTLAKTLAGTSNNITGGLPPVDDDTDINGDMLRLELDQRLGGWFGRLAEGWQDNIRSVRIFLDMLREKGTRVSDYNNFYMQYTALQGKNDAHLKDFGKRFMEAINANVLNIQKYTNYEYRDLENYVFLKHGIERNEYMREAAKAAAEAEGKKFRERDDYSGIYAIAAELWAKKNGISFNPKKKGEVEKIQADPDFVKVRDAIISEYISEFEKTISETIIPGHAKGEQLTIAGFWSAINAATNYSLDRLVSSGIESKAEVDDLKARYQYYVPLRGHEVEAEKVWQYEAPDNKNVVSKAIMQASGRASRAEHPFAYIIQMAQTSINKANRNQLNQTMLRLARMDKSGLMSVSEAWYVLTGTDPDTGKEIWTETEPEFSEDHEIRAEEIRAWNEKMTKLEEEGKAKRFKKGLRIGGLFIKPKQRRQHAISVYEDGVLYQVYINGNPRVSQAINELNGTKWNIPIITQTTRFISSMITSRSPQFMLTNGARDLAFASSILPSKEGARYTGQFLKNYPVAMAILANDATFNFGENDAQYKKYLKEFEMNGGETGYSHLLELQDIQKELYKKQKGKNYLNPVTDLEAIIAVIDAGNKVIENSTRLAVYITSRESGRSIERSVSDSKEVTLNFNRRGSGIMLASHVQSMFMFVNAGVQALANFGHVYKMHPVRMSATIGAYAAAGFIMPMIINAIGGDDDENEYMNMTDWERQTNLCLPTGGGFAKIPLPQEMRVFFKLGDEVYKLYSGRTEASETAMATLKSAADMIPISPLGTIASGEVNDIKDFYRVISFDAVRPLAELSSNTNFMGGQIYDKYKAEKEGLPGYQKARLNRVGDPRAPESIVGFTKWLDNVTGGDNVKKGAVSWNPDVVNHLAKSYLGGMYSLIAEGEKSFTKRFYTSNADIEEKNTTVKDYYKRTEQADELIRREKGYWEQLQSGTITEADYNAAVNQKEVDKAYDIHEYAKTVTRLERILKTGELTPDDELWYKNQSDSLKKEVIRIKLK